MATPSLGLFNSPIFYREHTAPASHGVSPSPTWGRSRGHPSLLNISLKIHRADEPCPSLLSFPYLSRTGNFSRLVRNHCGFYGNKNIWLASRAGGERCALKAASADLQKLLHRDESRPTHLQIADELIFSRGAAPVVCFHAGLTENVEYISQFILVQQVVPLGN